MPASRNQRSRSWSLDVMIGVAAVAAVVGIVLFMRPQTPDDETANTPRPLQPAAREPLKISERARQRADEAAAPPAAHNAPGERIVVPGGAPVAPNKVRPRGASAAPEQEAAPTPYTGRAADLPPEAIDLDDNSEDVAALTKVAFADPDPDRRLAAVELLSATEDPQVITVLARSLADENEEVRMAALQALSDFTGEVPAVAIESALHDPSADIRYEAVSMLAEVGSDRARSAIQQALNDPDDDVRFLAESVLDLHKQPDQGSAPAAPPRELPGRPAGR